MARVAPLALLSAGLLAVAACSDNQQVTSPRAADAVQQNDAAPHLGIVPVKGAATVRPLFANNGNELNHGNAGTTGNGSLVQAGIQYHGGPVLQSGTKVAAIYWASSVIYSGGPTPGTNGAGSADGSLVGFFLNHVGGSPYFNINTSYTDGSGLPIVNSVSYTQFWANNTSVPGTKTRVSDATMISMLQSGFNSGKLTYDPNTLYAIFTQGTVNLGGGFGTQYCAYHSNGTVTINGVSKTVLYAAMPDDYAKASSCSSGLASPNSDLHANAEVSTLIHEIEETTTDELGNAWWDSATGMENADKCAWTWGTTYTTANGGKANVNLGGKDFLIQRNWLNVGSGSCALSL